MDRYAERMLFARRRFVDRLAETHTGYRPGKLTLLESLAPGRQTLLKLDGPGVFRRLWTTHIPQDKTEQKLKLWFYLDGYDEPILHGLAHQLAAAAERIVTPEIPDGGFVDGWGVNLYLPIAFEASLRIEAEVIDHDDGIYWQIDYEQGRRIEPMPLRQEICDDGKPVIHLESESSCPQAPTNELLLWDEFDLSVANPQTCWLDGPMLIRTIEIVAEDLDALGLRISFDSAEPGIDGRCDGPFQVDAPLRYLVGPFNNALVERLGDRALIHLPMPFSHRAALQILRLREYGTFQAKHPVKLRVYGEPDADVADLRYCHLLHTTGRPNGRDDFECLSTAGRGHFVGLHLFDTGHDHGGGDNIMFDAATDQPGQLHGICGEDYFHMAYMRSVRSGPFAGGTNHAQRYRHHLEMPIPFEESFVFDFGLFAGYIPQAVAIWYQDQPSTFASARELTWRVEGLYRLDQMDDLTPDKPLPDTCSPHPMIDDRPLPRKSWTTRAQLGFVELCHAYRTYIQPYPGGGGSIPRNDVAVCTTRLVATRQAEATFRISHDDPIRVYLNGQCILDQPGQTKPDPLRQAVVTAPLCEGVNRLWVTLGNTQNRNWCWNGFALVIESDLDDDELLYVEESP